MNTPPLAEGHKANFHTLQRAFDNGAACLMSCKIKATGENVAVICAAQKGKDESIEFVPFAMLFNGNPYDILEPPE